MSRVSRKSELSPSITRGSNGIDLGKNSDVDMGRKSEPSITSGGIGLTQDITNVGGMNISGGIEVDITPVDFGVNYNASEGTVSIATGAEIPGGLLGVSGGIEIDLNTGEIIGGSIGGEVGGLGINVSNSEKGGLGIEFTVEVVPGIELSLGFGFPPKKPKITPTPAPSPSPTSPLPPTLPDLDPNCTYDIFILGLDQNRRFEKCTGYASSESSQGWEFQEGPIPTGESNAKLGSPVLNPSNGLLYPQMVLKKPIEGTVEIRKLGYGRPIIDAGDSIIPNKGVLTTIYDGVKLGGSLTVSSVSKPGPLGSNSIFRGWKGDQVKKNLQILLKN